MIGHSSLQAMTDAELRERLAREPSFPASELRSRGGTRDGKHGGKAMRFPGGKANEFRPGFRLMHLSGRWAIARMDADSLGLPKPPVVLAMYGSEVEAERALRNMLEAKDE